MRPPTIVLLAAIGLTTPAVSQPTPPAGAADSAAAAPFVTTAVFVDQPPRIDGRLDDPVWQSIPPITNFIQVWPSDGSPASERSEARIAYDRDHLYFAFRFYDRDPGRIRAKNLERGGRNDRDDHAYIGLDTYRDGRNAYLFEMNALGTQDDATITDESITIDSFSWDAVFRSETVIDDEGWTLEVSIPFSQLRFPEGEELEFGLMLSRMINRKNERVIWPRIGLEYGSFGAVAAVSQYGVLRGIRNVRRGRHIEIKPYVITGAQEVRDDPTSTATSVDVTRDFGVDFKYGLTSSLTLDLTVNTDFAQVEADNVQLNLTRFNLFFPEKREFFLERSGLFEHGTAQSTQTFFSRRIGLNEQILAGARLTGQIGRVSVGLLNIETGSRMNQFLGSRSTNNSVARIRTDIFPRATVGGIFTNLQRADRFNRAAGIDAQYRFWSYSEFSSWFTHVWQDDARFNDGAGHVGLRLQNDRYGASIAFTSVGENYDPALGFVRRRDMRHYAGRLLFSPVVDWKPVPAMRRIQLQTDYAYIEGQDGQLQSTEARFLSRLDFNRRDFLRIDVIRQFERLETPFSIRPDAVLPDADYDFARVVLSGETDSSRRLYGAFETSRGGFYSGDRTDLRGALGFRPSRHLNLEAELRHSWIDLPIPNGNFEATTARLSVLGAANRKLFAKALFQYDNFSRDLQANIRIDWIHTPGSDLFLVFNTSYHLLDGDDDVFDPRRNVIMNDRVGVAKLTYLLSI